MRQMFNEFILLMLCVLYQGIYLSYAGDYLKGQPMEFFYTKVIDRGGRDQTAKLSPTLISLTPFDETKKPEENQNKVKKRVSTEEKPRQSFKILKYSFKDINLLSDDMILRGMSPSYDFYIPVYRNVRKIRVTMKIFLPEYLRRDSSVSILVDDIPYHTIFVKDSGKPVEIEIQPKRGRDFVKITVRGYLRLSNNTCEDAFSDKVYLIISADSSLTIFYTQSKDIYTFLMDYERHYCVEDRKLLPIVYHLSKVRTIPPVFRWGIKDDCEKIILFSSEGETRLEGKTLYMNEKTLQAFKQSYRSLIFGEALNVHQVGYRKAFEKNMITFRELSIRTSTIRGMSNLSFNVLFNTASFGGMPDTLYLRLNFSHTPVHQKDKMEIRFYLNDVLIKAMPLEGSGTKSVDIKIPIQELFYGYNTLTINLVNFTSSDNCFGAVAQSAFTVFDDSYFYWNSVKKDAKTIVDFIRIMNGKIGLIVEDNSILPFAVRFLNIITDINKNIENLELLDNSSLKDLDFILRFEGQKNERKLFELYDPSNGSVIFSAKYSLPFVFVMIKSGSVPELSFQSFGIPNYEYLSALYNISDYMNLYGNVAIISENYFASFDTLGKLRLVYPEQKSISYYWNKYKLFIILLLAIPLLYIILYTYRKLTRRAL